MESIYLEQDNQKINLLTEEAQINTYYNMSINSDFDIVYETQEMFNSYTLYSGNKMISTSTNGRFSNLKPGSFSVNAPVYLEIQKSQLSKIIKKLNINVVNISPPSNVLAIGDDVVVKISDDFPLVGGETFTIDIPDLPVEWNYKTDGTIQGGINIGHLIASGEKFNEIFPGLRNINSDTISQYLREKYPNLGL